MAALDNPASTTDVLTTTLHNYAVAHRWRARLEALQAWTKQLPKGQADE